MRITILSRHFPPAVSGIGDHTDMLAAELTRRGMTVTVVTAPGAEERASYHVDATAGRWDGAGFAVIAEAVRRSEPDAVVWQYNPFSIGRKGLAPRAGHLARALAGIAPLTVVFHELWFPWGRNGLRGILWATVQRWQIRGVLRAASRWIVTTESRERALARRDASRVVRIPVGTNIEPRAYSGDARGSRGIPADAFVVAHFGSVGPGRDLRPAFHAFRDLVGAGIDARLLLIGSTGPFEAPRDLSDRIHATGPATREEISGALQAADVYLHADPAGPSAGRRTTIVAALAHALPVVSYAGPDHALELRDGINCIVSEPTSEALARALRELAEDPERARQIGTQGRKTYEHHFSWERIGNEVLRVLK